MSYLPEKINISLFSKGSSSPTPVNPEELVDLDLSENSNFAKRGCYVSSMHKSSVVKNCLVTGVKKVGDTSNVVTIDVGEGVDTIKCSPNRLIMLYKGGYKMAKDLRKSDQLMGVCSPVSIVNIHEELLPDSVDVYDIITDPECENYITTSGVFIGKVLLKEVLKSLETLSMNPDDLPVVY